MQQRELIRTAFAPAMNGILLCSFLLLLLSIVGIIYARRKGTMWHERMPIVGFESINTGSLEGKLYQFAALFGFSMIPALGLVKYWSTLSLARVVTTAETPQVLPSIWSWSGLTSFEDPARICLMLVRTSQGNPSCDPSNFTFLPGLEPTMLAAWTAIALGATAVHWGDLYRRRVDPNDSSY